MLNPLPLPYNGNMSASAVGDGAYANADQTYNLGPSGLQVDVTQFDRYGPSGVQSNGAWLFSVTQTIETLAKGYLDAEPSVYSNETYLSAVLDDLTGGTRLFQSIQWDHAAGGIYALGGLTGMRTATFTGSLDNVLVPDHVYRLIYTLSVSNPEAAADGSQAFGQISLQAATTPIPEPATFTLMLVALLGLFGVTPRSSRRLTLCGVVPPRGP